MKYLLDTHTFIWLDSNPDELSEKAKETLLDIKFKETEILKS